MLTPLENWFATRGWTPFAFQREVWRAYLAGENGLIHAATGTGKTYAAWLGPLAEYLAEQQETPPAPRRRNDAPPLRVIWLTPLRALAADTEQALRVPLEALGLPWTLEARTGDTSAAVRARQRKQLPTALLTTPESLSLLLTRPDAAELFASLRAVIVDEWHELMASKRGTQTELALARLRTFAPGMRTWGLSATLGNLATALHALVSQPDTGRIIRGEEPKAITIDTLIPDQIERFPWAGHLGLRMLPQVADAIEASESALVFTNTRAQTELWYQSLLDARPDWAGEIALHHGSLSRDVREWVEDALKEGRLRAVVSTSSLDLGVDFAPVDRVLQVGSPKGVARLLQRAGRSGHRPGATSRVTCVPTNAFELVEAAAARHAALAGQIESRPPYECPLDVLVQHLVTVAIGGGFAAPDLLREVRTTYAFRNLSDAEWAWALSFVTEGGPALQNYDDYRRVVRTDNGRYVVTDDRIAKRHRNSIGTITGDASISVRFLRGETIGTVEESFAARLKPGDAFVFAGRVLEFIRIRDMTVWVRLAKGSAGVVPRWGGSRLPLSSELAAAVRDRLDEVRLGVFEDPELVAMRPLLAVQQRWSRIPAADELLVERAKTREGYHLFFFPFEGRQVHEGLAALFAYRLSRRQPQTFSISVNDYGFELLSPTPVIGDDALEFGLLLLSAENLLDDVVASLNASELARRQFREIARVAGLVYQGFPGEKNARQLQASSGLIYDVLRQYDPDNMLLVQAGREVLERQLERSRLSLALERLRSGQFTLVDVARPTPFAFPLLIERVRDTISSEKLADRIRRLTAQLEKAAG